MESAQGSTLLLNQERRRNSDIIRKCLIFYWGTCKMYSLMFHYFTKVPFSFGFCFFLMRNQLSSCCFLYVMFSPVCLLLRFSLYFWCSEFDYDVFGYNFLCFYAVQGLQSFLDLWVTVLIQLGKLPSQCFFKYFLPYTLLSFWDSSFTHIRPLIALYQSLSLYFSPFHFSDFLKIGITYFSVLGLLSGSFL